MLVLLVLNVLSLSVNKLYDSDVVLSCHRLSYKMVEVENLSILVK